MDTFYALITGVVIVAAPILLLLAAVFLLALIFAPAILRAVTPSRSSHGKWLLVTALVLLQLVWLAMRGASFWAGVRGIHHLHFSPLDLLLVLAWLSLSISLLTWPGRSQK